MYRRPGPCLIASLLPFLQPSPPLQDLADVLREAVAAAGGRLRQVPDGAAAFQLPAICGPRHRAAQYVQLQQLFGEQAAG